VEEPAFLVAVQGIVGGIEVEHDLPQRLAVRIEEHIDEHVLQRLAIAADLVMAGASVAGGMFQVLLPASGAQSLRLASRLSPNNASTGSKRNLSWSLTSS
jgi:hypothetical protein